MDHNAWIHADLSGMPATQYLRDAFQEFNDSSRRSPEETRSRTAVLANAIFELERRVVALEHAQKSAG